MLNPQRTINVIKKLVSITFSISIILNLFTVTVTANDSVFYATLIGAKSSGKTQIFNCLSDSPNKSRFPTFTTLHNDKFTLKLSDTYGGIHSLNPINLYGSHIILLTVPYDTEEVEKYLGEYLNLICTEYAAMINEKSMIKIVITKSDFKRSDEELSSFQKKVDTYLTQYKFPADIGFKLDTSSISTSANNNSGIGDLRNYLFETVVSYKFDDRNSNYLPIINPTIVTEAPPPTHCYGTILGTTFSGLALLLVGGTIVTAVNTHKQKSPFPFQRTK